MEKKPRKKKFFVEEGESISDCLDRLTKEGYTPVRRLEEPIFHEVNKNGKAEKVILRQNILFEGKIVE